MNKILIFTNPDKDVEFKLTKELSDYIELKGAEVITVVDDFTTTNSDADLSMVDAVIVLGGDGTMLRAAHYIGEYDAPLLGINLGTLGFLTEIEACAAKEAIDRLLTGDYEIEERMMCKGEAHGKVFHALNDVVISRAGFSRVIGLKIWVNGQMLDTYMADGVIISTPTGSTGYNLSAGGPIVSPKSKVLVLTPISPHSLMAKSVILDTDDVLEIEVVKQRKTQEKEAIVSFDGGKHLELSAKDIVRVSVSEMKTNVIKMRDVSFYKVLRDKIGGI